MRKAHRKMSMTDSRWSQFRWMRAATSVAAIGPPRLQYDTPRPRGGGAATRDTTNRGMSQRLPPAHPPRRRPRVLALRVNLLGLLPRIPLRRIRGVADIDRNLRVRAVAR